MFLNIIVTFYSFVSYVVLCIENRPCVELNLFCKFSTSAGRSGSTSMLQVILSFIENIRNQRMTEKVTPLINILYRRNPLPFKNAQCVSVDAIGSMIQRKKQGRLILLFITEKVDGRARMCYLWGWWNNLDELFKNAYQVSGREQENQLLEWICDCMCRSVNL